MTLASAEVSDPAAWVTAGRYALRGVAQPQELFTLVADTAGG